MRIRIRQFDRLNIIIEQQHFTKANKEHWRVIGYYGMSTEVARALIALAGVDTIENDSVKELVAEFIDLTGKKIDAIGNQLSEMIENGTIELEL
jgi:hypothetical protein